MRLVVALLALLSLSTLVGACGGNARSSAAARLASSSNSSTSDKAGTASASAVGSAPSRSGAYLNDGDLDRIGDEDGDNRQDVDNDAAADYKPQADESSRYHDADDTTVLAYGHPAPTSARRAIAALVNSYYTAAAASDGRSACRMLIESLVRAVPEDYGQYGPSYLRGAKTCDAVMERVFTHSHDELIRPVVVTGVRMNGAHAYAFLGSPEVRASYLTVQRTGTRWTVSELLANPLP